MGKVKANIQDTCEEKKDVTVVVPVFNSEDTIVQVLFAIERQTAVGRINKIVVVNDGSDDNSRLKIEEYRNTASIDCEVIHKENGGVSSARNAGVNVAGNVKWIAFCDSDDLWHVDKLEKQLKILDRNPNIDCLGAQFGKKKLRIGLKTIDCLHRGTVREICIKNFPSPSTVIIKKNVFIELGGFDETQRFAEDGNFFLNVAANYELYYLPEVLVEFGFGKNAYGEKGLSSNLRGMYMGNVANLREMKDKKYIKVPFFVLMRLYFWIKYLRRIVITQANKLCNR